MTGVRHVLKLYQPTDLDYPRFLGGHRRNRGVDFSALGRYAEGASNGGDTGFKVFMRASKPFDAVWIAGIAMPLVLNRLRDVLGEVAGDCITFNPVEVNDEPFWTAHVDRVIDALDAEQSSIEYAVDGTVKSVQEAIWGGDLIEDPLMFRIPQLRSTIWATPGVALAFERSGCDGMSFGVYGNVV